MRKLDDAAVLRCHMYRSRFSGNDRPKHKSKADKETHLVLEQVLSEVIILDNYPRTRIDIVFRVLQVSLLVVGEFCFLGPSSNRHGRLILPLTSL